MTCYRGRVFIRTTPNAILYTHGLLSHLRPAPVLALHRRQIDQTVTPAHPCWCEPLDFIRRHRHRPPDDHAKLDGRQRHRQLRDELLVQREDLSSSAHFSARHVRDRRWGGGKAGCLPDARLYGRGWYAKRLYPKSKKSWSSVQGVYSSILLACRADARRGYQLGEIRFTNVSLAKTKSPDLADIVYEVFRCSDAHGEEVPMAFPSVPMKMRRLPGI